LDPACGAGGSWERAWVLAHQTQGRHAGRDGRPDDWMCGGGILWPFTRRRAIRHATIAQNGFSALTAWVLLPLAGARNMARTVDALCRRREDTL